MAKHRHTGFYVSRTKNGKITQKRRPLHKEVSIYKKHKPKKRKKDFNLKSFKQRKKEGVFEFSSIRNEL